MPWYFYGKEGYPVTPIAVGVLGTGSIVLSSLPYGSTPPDGFVFCEGQPLLKNSYLDLFSVISTIYGESTSINPNDSFHVPDLRGRMLRGIITGASGIGAISGVGGSKTHTHTLDGHIHTNSASLHDHTVANHTHSTAHTHDTANHAHPGDTYNLSTASPSFGIAAGVDQDSSKVDHDHNDMTNFTGITNPGASGASSNATSGFASSQTLTTHGAVVSGSSAPVLSDPVTQLPPYLTMSFLIKT